MVREDIGGFMVRRSLCKRMFVRLCVLLPLPLDLTIMFLPVFSVFAGGELRAWECSRPMGCTFVCVLVWYQGGEWSVEKCVR